MNPGSLFKKKMKTKNQAQARAFEKTKKRHKSGIILKSGSATKTDTNLHSRKLILETQTAERAHFASSLLAEKVKKSPAQVKQERDALKAAVKLASAHSQHHSSKARRDALERLARFSRRLFNEDDEAEAASFNVNEERELILDATMRAWCDSDEKTRSLAMEIYREYLPFLIPPQVIAVVRPRLFSHLLLALTHIQADVRLAGRKLLSQMLSTDGNDSVGSANVSLWTIEAVVQIGEALLAHMRFAVVEDLAKAKATDVVRLMPRLLSLFSLPNAESQTDGEAVQRVHVLEYEWKEHQEQFLALVRRPLPTASSLDGLLRVEMAERSVSERLKQMLGSFQENIRLPLLLLNENQKEAKDEDREVAAAARPHIIHIARLMDRLIKQL